MKKSVRLWYLYDFANSFALIVLLFYYPLILSEKGANTMWVGISASISTLVLLLLLPYIGADSDKRGRKLVYIRIGSVCMVAALSALALLLQHNASLSLATLLVLTVLYIIFQLSYQSSYVIYSSMLRSLSKEDTSVKISGVGVAVGQFGNAVALLVIGLLLGTSAVILGVEGKSLALLLGACMFALLASPFLLQKDVQEVHHEQAFSYRDFLTRIYEHKKIFYFLIGYSLLADAILTFQLYITLYIKKVFLFSDQLVSYAGIVGLLSGVVGGFVAHKIAAFYHDKERALRIASLLYASCFGICALLPQIPQLVFMALALIGFSFGLVFSLSRAVYAQLAPENEQAKFFSFYTIFERAAAVVGPLLWLLIFYTLSNFSEQIRFRSSVFFLLFICICGYFFLSKSSRTRD